MRVLLIGVFTLLQAVTFAKELVIATTFSPEVTQQVISEWQAHSPNQNIRLINRTASSLQRLLDNPHAEQIDLVLSSSLFLFQHLHQQEKLALLPSHLLRQSTLIPENLAQTTTAVAFSGYGILFNKHLLKAQQLNEPFTLDDLLTPHYLDSVLVSSPSRSSTNHIMLEMLLQQRGWQVGWQTWLSLVPQISTISSRSFNVADRVKMGFVSAGITIDSYANRLLTDPNLGFHYFPNSVASPTLIAISRQSRQPALATEFIDFLLTPIGQEMISAVTMSKFPLQNLPPIHPLAAKQQQLLAQPPLDYTLLTQRQVLVEKLFDVAITFRLHQLKTVWQHLHEKERKLKRSLPTIRELLTSLPVSEAQANDTDYLARLQHDKHFVLTEEQRWTTFFQEQINQALLALEDEK
ncbi:TPA: ABC transporter substrate-binding protein [Mannheimia haemolytica]